MLCVFACSWSVATGQLAEASVGQPKRVERSFALGSRAGNMGVDAGLTFWRKYKPYRLLEVSVYANVIANEGTYREFCLGYEEDLASVPSLSERISRDEAALRYEGEVRTDRILSAGLSHFWTSDDTHIYWGATGKLGLWRSQTVVESRPYFIRGFDLFAACGDDVSFFGGDGINTISIISASGNQDRLRYFSSIGIGGLFGYALPVAQRALRLQIDYNVEVLTRSTRLGVRGPVQRVSPRGSVELSRVQWSMEFGIAYRVWKSR